MDNEVELTKEEIEARIEELQQENGELDYNTRFYQEPGAEGTLNEIAERIDKNNEEIERLRGLLPKTM